MECCEDSWNDWIISENEYSSLAINDKKAMQAGAGKHLNFISIIAHKI